MKATTIMQWSTPIAAGVVLASAFAWPQFVHAAESTSARTPPAELGEFFVPPEKYRSDFGSFRSPLIFADGSPVRNTTDWQRRRAEILSTWHKTMGAWPPLIEQPRVELVNTTRREHGTQHQHRV